MATRVTAKAYTPIAISAGDVNRPQAAINQRRTKIAEMTVKGRASPSFSGGLKESRARAQYYLEWDPNPVVDNIAACRRDFVGYSETKFNDSGNVSGIYRHIPYPHPKEPNYLYAEQVESVEPDVPIGFDSENVARYDEAKVAVQFGTRPYVVLDDGVFQDPNAISRGNVFGEYLCQQYVSISIQTIGRYERVPSRSTYRFGGLFNGQPIYDLQPRLQGQLTLPPIVSYQAPLPENLPAGPINFPAVSNAMNVSWSEAEVYVTWYQIPFDAIPWSAISRCINKVESAPSTGAGAGIYTFLSNTYLGPILQEPAGTRVIPKFVCLNPSISDPYQMVNGVFAVDIKYKFHYYPYGAGYFFNWNTGTFQAAFLGTAGQGGAKPFFNDPQNFNNLFWSN